MHINSPAGCYEVGKYWTQGTGQFHLYEYRIAVQLTQEAVVAPHGLTETKSLGLFRLLLVMLSPHVLELYAVLGLTISSVEYSTPRLGAQANFNYYLYLRGDTS